MSIFSVEAEAFSGSAGSPVHIGCMCVCTVEEERGGAGREGGRGSIRGAVRGVEGGTDKAVHS